MIGSLTGRLARRSPERVLLDVGGVGYDVRIPLSTFYALTAAGESTVVLHVHTHVRDDALELFGFFTEQERTAFEKLIAISGVGPRLALAILSGIGVDELRTAVARRDHDRLERIPGVGKKTAERVLLELRDRFAAPAGPGGAGGAPADAPERDAVREDALSALVNLGYSRQVASRAVGRVLDDGPTTGIEGVLKAALASLVR